MTMARPTLWREHGGRAACLAMLESMLPHLSDAERRVAEYVLHDPEQVVLSPITRVAAESGVAPSTVVRLCSRLGVSGFQELKIAMTVELAGLGRFALQESRPLDGDQTAGDPATVVRRAIEVAIDNLTSTAGLLDPGAVERVGRAMIAAPRIVIYAQGPVTSGIGHILQARLLLGGTHSTVHTYPFEHMSAGLLQPGDLALGLSQSGETEAVVNAIAAAQQVGATTVCITGAPESSLTRHAEICLLAAAQPAEAASRWPSSMLSQWPSSLVSMLVVVEAINAFILLQRYQSQGDRQEEP